MGSNNLARVAYDVEDGPGDYVIILQGTIVGEEVELESKDLAKLEMGQIVKVVEVQRHPDIKRVRAKIESPAGWISLENLDDGQRWARPAREDQLVDVQSIYATKAAFAALKTDCTVVAWGSHWQGGDTTRVQAQLVHVQTIYCTDVAFAALKADGNVVAWGDEIEIEKAKSLASRGPI